MSNGITTLPIATKVVAQRAGARTLRAVEYLRVSTEEQRKGYGVASQGKKTSGYIRIKGWECVDRYTDEAVSGSLEVRT